MEQCRLAQSIGFHDFAGGTAVHVVGGTTALIGALLVGARIGKFDKTARREPYRDIISLSEHWAYSFCG